MLPRLCTILYYPEKKHGDPSDQVSGIQVLLGARRLEKLQALEVRFTSILVCLSCFSLSYNERGLLIPKKHLEDQRKKVRIHSSHVARWRMMKGKKSLCNGDTIPYDTLTRRSATSAIKS